MENNEDVKESSDDEQIEEREEKIIKSSDYDENSFLDLRTNKGKFLLFIITLGIGILVQLEFPIDEMRNIFKQKECRSVPRKPTYWIYGKGGEGQWIHVNKVLQRLGLERVYENESSTADLLWAHDYPFNTLKSKIINFKPHQKINHFPGCGFLTNKVDLATTDMKYIPKAFRLPKDEEKFKKYSIENPDKLFLVKHYQHRHIKIQKISDINFSNNETFIQEFIANPLLVDGHKFDIGVYTIITSIDPLRVYIYTGDTLFRYCPAKYHPFDPENLDKYVVGDDYLPTWEVPSLSRYYNSFGLGMKGSFDAYMQVLGKDTQKIWWQVEDAIRLAILTKYPSLRDAANKFKNKQSFFEMDRFDLIIDDNLKVYLIEANMSPNLSSAHFKQNSLLYEQVLYNLMGLVGVSNYVHKNSFDKLQTEEEAMISAEKNVMVNGVICSQPPCSESCSSVECQLCKPCMDRGDINEIHRAYREHVNKGDTKRIFPVPNRPIDDNFFKTLSPKNQMITKWFHAKCQEHKNWCN